MKEMNKELKKLEKVLPKIFGDSHVTATFRIRGRKAKLISLEVEEDEDMDEDFFAPKVRKSKIGYIC